MRSRSACACWTDTPGFSRPTPFRKYPEGLLGSAASGVHRPARSGNTAPRGRTPITVYACSVEFHDPAQHIAIGLKHPLPEVIVQQHDFGAAELIVLRPKVTADHRLQTEDVQ